MPPRHRIAFVFGTRPEAIKLCPLILAMRQHPRFEPHVCVTAQHREMLDQVLEVFGVQPDVDLGLMQANQTLAGLTSRAVAALDGYLAEHQPEMVLAQGDTTTVLCAALAAFYRRIPVGHVEAGLRTWNKLSPYPEEMNRTLTTKLADLHFAPTNWSRDNLVREGVAPDKIIVTGNTVIDALFFALDRVRKDPPLIPGLPLELMNGQTQRPLVLITGHRRENFGPGFESICRAIAELAGRFPDVHFVYPVHLNPNVREPVARILGEFDDQCAPSAAIGSASRNIHLIQPLSYLPFVALMNRSTIILTDSGGLQEEAPSLGKPVLVMRDTTERPEAVQAGTVKLVGTDCGLITSSVTELLTNKQHYDRMSAASNPYGDGQACGRILDCLESTLNVADSSRTTSRNRVSTQ